MRFTAVLPALALCALGFSQVNPPSWWNVNDGNTTSQSYTFETAGTVFDPALEMNPFGTPSWTGSGFWSAQVDDHLGVIGAPAGQTAQFTLHVPNDHNAGNVKFCWLQLDFNEVPGQPSFGDLTLAITPEQGSITFTGGGEEALEAGWRRATLEFLIQPQPEWEDLTFTFVGGTNGIWLDNLHFGTHCARAVPEPASLVVVGLGIAALVRKRPRGSLRS